MKIRFKWVVISIIAALILVGVMRSLSASKAKKEALQSQLNAQKVLTPIDLLFNEVALSQTVELSQTLPFSGTIKAVNSALIKARVPGEIQNLTVREGDFVKAGQVLARIDDTEVKARVRQAQQQAQSAKAQVDIAKRSYNNNSSLVDQGFISKTALDTSTANLAAAEANYMAAQAGLDLANKSADDSLLRSPISGQVSQRLAQNGERVGVDTRILEVVDIGKLELEASLSTADSLAIKVGQTAKLRVEGLDKEFTAKVHRINPSATAGSRAVLAYLSIESGSGLRQGLFAEGQLATDKVTSLAVPLSAIRTDKPQPYIQYIKDGKVIHQIITPGVRGYADGQIFVAVEGVQENTQVLLGSAGVIREGSPVNILKNAK